MIAQIRKVKPDITIEGALEDVLGVNIDRNPNGTIHLTQPYLIDSILKDLSLLGERVKIRDTRSSSLKF